LITEPENYAARLDVDYPEELNRLTTLLRVIWIIPILIILALLTGSAGDALRRSGGGISAGLVLATALMIVFREVYPRWWFDFARELTRFSGRVVAYLALLTDRYPSAVDEQAVHLEVDYPNVEPRPEPMATAREVAARDPALHRAHHPLDPRSARRGGRVVRDSVHRKVSEGAVRLRRWRREVGAPSTGVRVPTRDRPLPAVSLELRVAG